MMIYPRSYRQLRKLHRAKPVAERWVDYACRLGIEARFEGRPVSTNPFPPGFLRTQWEGAWVETNETLGRTV